VGVGDPLLGTQPPSLEVGSSHSCTHLGDGWPLLHVLNLYRNGIFLEKFSKSPCLMDATDRFTEIIHYINSCFCFETPITKDKDLGEDSASERCHSMYLLPKSKARSHRE
jgi:hypothetical protein